MVRNSEPSRKKNDCNLDDDTGPEIAQDLYQIMQSQLARTVLMTLHDIRLSMDETTAELDLEEVLDVTISVNRESFPERPAEAAKTLDTELLPLMDRCGILQYHESVRVVRATKITSLVLLALTSLGDEQEARAIDTTATSLT